MNKLINEIEYIKKLLSIVENRIKQLENNIKKEYINRLFERVKQRRILNLKLIENEKKDKLVQCSGMNILDNHLERCTNESNKKYCSEHENKYRFEKTDCPICMDEISEETETPLECGHWIHKECLVPTNLHICPVCRQNMKQNEIDFVFGKNHESENLYGRNYHIPFLQEPEEVQILNQQIIANELRAYNEYVPTSIFYNENPRQIKSMLLEIRNQLENGQITYFVNSYPRYYTVPQSIYYTFQAFVNEFIINILNEHLLRINMPVSHIDIKNRINNLSSDKKNYMLNMLSFFFNIKIIDRLWNDFLINERIKITFADALHQFNVVP